MKSFRTVLCLAVAAGAAALSLSLASAQGDVQGDAQGQKTGERARSESGQQGEKQPQDDGAKGGKKTAQQIVEALLAKEGIRVDKKRGVVLAEGTITVTKDFLEYVAIGPNGKKHEALVTLRCKGSTLNAALLALGLRPGTNVDFEEIVPRPTLEEYEAGAPLDRLILPKGPRLWLSVSWHDEDDKLVQRRVEDLIVDVTTREAIQGAKWVYTKALVAPIEKDKDPVFIADFEGNYISNYFTKPDSHFITIVHERARDDGNWYANTKVLPPRGTECTLTISTKPQLPGDSKADPDAAIRKKIAELDKKWAEKRAAKKGQANNKKDEKAGKRREPGDAPSGKRK